MASSSRCLRIAATFALCTVAALSLFGCGAKGHDIIPQNTDCLRCHTDARDALTESDVSADVTCNGTLTVTTKLDYVYICTPLFSSTDAKYCVPMSLDRVAVTNGEAQLQLAEGLWAIAVDKGDTSSFKLVQVSSGADAASIKL